MEEEIIKLFDEVEAAQEEVKREKQRLDESEKNYKAREIELNQQEKKLTENLENLKKQRQEVVSQLPLDLKNMYDLIIQKKQGMALAKVKGQICGSCQIQLRAQILNEVLLGESFIVCENCSRILYFEA